MRSAPARVPGRVWDRRDAWCAFVLAVVTSAAAVLSITPHPAGVFQDDGAYVVLAKALAQGDGYRFINLPNAPAATHFPPLYPLWLAGLWKIGPAFPANIQFFKFANGFLLGIAAAGAFTFARRRLAMRMWTAALATLAACACTPVLGMSRMVLSEPAFLAMLFPLLFLAERTADGPSARNALAAGLAGGALGLLRTLGMFLVPATALVLIARRRWRDAALVVLGGALVLVPWQLWTVAHAGDLATPIAGKYGSYFAWFVDGVRVGGWSYVATVVTENAQFSGTFLVGTFGLTATPAAARYALVLVVAIILALGMLQLWRHARVTAAFLAIYLAVVLIWPFPPDRFYWGVWPLLAFVFVIGMRRVAHSAFARAPRHRMALAAVGAALVVLYGGPQFFHTSRPWVWHIQEITTDRSRAIVQWVNDNTRPNDLIATEDDAMVYLYTGRVAVPISAFTPRDRVQPQTREFARGALEQLLQEYPVRWLMPVTWVGINASSDVARLAPSHVAFRQALKLGAVFERLPATEADH